MTYEERTQAHVAREHALFSPDAWHRKMRALTDQRSHPAPLEDEQWEHAGEEE